MVSKKVKIGTTAVGVTTIIGLFLVLSSMGLIITSDGDKFCEGTIEDPCVSYINITNPMTRQVTVENKKSIRLDITPGVQHYEMYILRNGEWMLYDFSFKHPDMPKSAKYVYAFKPKKTTQLKLVTYKESSGDVVKWGIGANDDYLDPVWFGIEYDCKNFSTKYHQIFVKNIVIIKNNTYSYISNETKQKVVVINYYNETIPEYKMIKENYCEKKDIESIKYKTLKNNLVVNYDIKYKYTLESDLLIIADHDRGAGKNTVSCVDNGIPCKLINITTGQVLVEYRDVDVKVRI